MYVDQRRFLPYVVAHSVVLVDWGNVKWIMNWNCIFILCNYDTHDILTDDAVGAGFGVITRVGVILYGMYFFRFVFTFVLCIVMFVIDW